MTVPVSPRTLSKSDYKVARECPAKLYFRENHYPDQNQFDAYLSLLRDGAYMVEALAQAKRPTGILCEYGVDPQTDASRTLEYLLRDNVTLFQATLVWGRRLVRVDIIEKTGSIIKVIEVKSKSVDSVEHAESLYDGGFGVFRAKRKPYGIASDWTRTIEDLAYQTIVARNALPSFTIEPWLILVDKSKRSRVDNVPSLFHLSRDEEGQGANRHNYTKYIGSEDQLKDLDLLAEIAVSSEIEIVNEAVESASVDFESILDSQWNPSFAAHSASCGACEFKLDGEDPTSGYATCWGSLAYIEPHILELSRVGSCKYTNGESLIPAMFAEGKASLLDVPEQCLCKKDGTIGPQAAQQLRQIKYTRAGGCWIGENLKRNIDSLSYPLHFIDFEASRLALPYHSGMRPYGQVAFQWSCHSVAKPGATPTHHEWLNTTEIWPNGSFARSLREVIGDSDTVLTWSGFEGTTLREIDRELHYFEDRDPDLVAWIDKVVNNRIVDLHAWARDEFYHPGMKGRTSIKVVMDALWRSDKDIRDHFTTCTGTACSESEDPYAALPPLMINGEKQDVREGTGAIRAYEAMMYGCEKDNEEGKALWCELLTQYCNLDTLSMVLIFDHWRRVAA